MVVPVVLARRLSVVLLPRSVDPVVLVECVVGGGAGPPPLLVDVLDLFGRVFYCAVGRYGRGIAAGESLKVVGGHGNGGRGAGHKALIRECLAGDLFGRDVQFRLLAENTLI